MLEKLVYKIVNKETGEFVGSYTRGNYDKYEFTSEYEARNSNCHGVFKDETKYDIKCYKVSYTENPDTSQEETND